LGYHATDPYGFEWRITKVHGLTQGPCSLLDHDEPHKLGARIATMLPQGGLPNNVKEKIRNYVVNGKLKFKHVMRLLQSEFPALVTSERQVRNFMN
jgi:hypothetical protein